MGYYLSVDSGGTKTTFLVANEEGQVIGKHFEDGYTCSTMKFESIYHLLKKGAAKILNEYHIAKKDLAYVVWGIACFGECKEFDTYLSKKLEKLFLCKSYFCNDVEIGMAGSLLLENGVHIVAGTGAIVMGKNEKGDKARANGWHEVFSDEGSAHWLGREALSLFAKQADGREEKSYLYQLFYEYFHFENDMDIICYYKEHLDGSRKRIAAVQKILLEAAEKGDISAILLYKKAANELANSVKGVTKQLQMKEKEIKVSYYGGAFKAGNFLLKPLEEYLNQQGMILLSPELSPECGGILIAAEKLGQQNRIDIIKNLRQYEREQL